MELYVLGGARLERTNFNLSVRDAISKPALKREPETKLKLSH